ncbi:MAG: cytochrome c biogenesis protein CcsA [Bacteroidetes bacterium]|nr:cytochrome c biogenesis protein CcsA [Bacteroidota bacterium]
MQNEVKFLGEHLLIGNIGQLAIVLSFTLSILASISFFLSTKQSEENTTWLKIGRTAFWLQCIAVVTVFVSLFYIIYHHYYEYHYAWSHSSDVLPTKYMISCFWEGQEGSFLLWIIWQALLGALIMWKVPKSWEKHVMAIISVSQVMLTSMILGVVIGDVKLGSSPFTLMREAMLDAPIFQQANYLEFIKDGNGLNPLLQNNWMVIHPPTLFFGFASTLIPFAFALAGLWQKRYTEWIKPALPWALVSLCVLGTGIVMGAAWAYESLSFGGYWNWDPVENASLLPWLLMAAAIHAMVIYNSTKKSAHASIILAVATFLSVLYATFLTRSGVLGDSSVHSFTDLGLSGQLLVWLVFFILSSGTIIFRTWSHYQSSKDEDRFSAREFWMFIGALIFLLSSIHIVTVTSIPVYNKIAMLFNKNLKMAPPTDVIAAYHFIQIPIAILLALGSGIAQYLKYKSTASLKSFGLRMGAYFLISLVLGSMIFYYANLEKIIYGILLVSSIFALIANSAYVFAVLKANFKAAGAAISHLGFAMILIGVIFSSAKNGSSQKKSKFDTLGFTYWLNNNSNKTSR